MFVVMVDHVMIYWTPECT